VHVRLASEIAPDWLLDLFPDHIDEKQSVRFDAAAEKVEALSAMTYRTLVLDESPLPHPSEEMKRVLVEAAWDAGPHTFAPEDALARFLARARFAAAHAKDLEAPTEATVRQALGLLADGKRSFREMRHESLVDVLKGLCSTHLATIDRLAPEKLTLPGGRTSTLAYEEGKVPWLEVFLQDFFGTLRTPRVADGAVPVVLHLLGPNRRAVQVTSDLEGFWERHYPAIRKELMRKYPRHFWPEDPKSAAPMLRTPKKV
jgi:ATP-dependent helicase HrpB